MVDLLSEVSAFACDLQALSSIFKALLRLLHIPGGGGRGGKKKAGKTRWGSVLAGCGCYERNVYLAMLMKSAFVKYFANSRSEAAFLPRAGLAATAFFKFSTTPDGLFVRAASTAFR